MADPGNRPVPHRPETLDEEILNSQIRAVLSTASERERLERIQEELAMGFGALGDVGPAVSIFGSARTAEEDPDYALARAVAHRLGDEGFAIITGGGPGIMQAANEGAREAGVRSVGLNIELPFEQHSNPYLDVPLEFHFFFVRKVMFVRYASAFVVFPGGFGTLDELFESLTLIQTGKIRDFPVVLVGSAYWSGLLEWVRRALLDSGKIAERDLDLVRVSDDVEEIARLVREGAERQGVDPTPDQGQMAQRAG
ncbi:MAG: TIGR00730 family Rossman fold protein [Candidatus Dormibacteria bacterium]